MYFFVQHLSIMSYHGITTITAIFTRFYYTVFVIWSVPSLTTRDAMMVIIEITTISHKNMVNKILNAGKGTKGTILTMLIHPKQPLPDGSNPNKRSSVIVED